MDGRDSAAVAHLASLGLKIQERISDHIQKIESSMYVLLFIFFIYQIRTAGRTMETTGRAKIICSIILIFLLGAGIWHVKTVMEDRSKNADAYYTYEEILWAVSKLSLEPDIRQEILSYSGLQKKHAGVQLSYVIRLGEIMQLPEGYYIGLIASERESRHIISKEEWERVYDYMVEQSPLSDVSIRQVYVSDPLLIGNEGENYLSENVNLQPYMDQVVDAYVQLSASEDGQGLVYAVKGIGTRPIIFRNAYVTLGEDGRADIFFSGIEMFIPYTSKHQTQELADSSELSETGDPDRSSGIADVTLTASGIEDIVFKDEYTTTKVTEISEQSIHLKELGTYEMDTNFRIYNAYGRISEEPSPNVLLGYNQVSFVIEDEKLQAAIIREGLATKNIRVLLSDNEGYYHSYVEFTSDTDFSVNYGNRIVVYEADEIVTIHTDHEDAGSDITVAPNQPTGTVTVMSMNKSGNVPSYRGSIEVSLKEQGFILINELPVEEYLFAVVSSEMPSTYDTEALKVQAICARGYAYSRINQKMYSAYGAHVDDTTACQVYNNVPETESTIYAVKDTFGMVPVYEDEIIEAFYFSTSGGTTCSNDEVWSGKKEGYLNSGLETPEGGTPAFADEEEFRYFIDHGQEYDTFEKELPFYRWKVFYTYEDMTNAVNSVLAGRMSDDLKCFAVMTEDGSFQPVDAPMESIGEIEDITVTKRGDSGIILEMVLIGSDATIRVTGQANVRYLFSPEDVIITKQDGTENSGWTSLPSPFYYIEKDDTAGGFLIAGGGFGHGVGMSQNGANEMAKQGYTCEEIIKHYYQGITIEKIIS